MRKQNLSALLVLELQNMLVAILSFSNPDKERPLRNWI